MHPALFASHAASIPDTPRAQPLHPDSTVDAALLAAIIVGALVVIGGVGGYVVWTQRSPRRTQGGESAPPPVYMPHGTLGAPSGIFISCFQPNVSIGQARRGPIFDKP